PLHASSSLLTSLATTDPCPLSLHDALPISCGAPNRIALRRTEPNNRAPQGARRKAPFARKGGFFVPGHYVSDRNRKHPVTPIFIDRKSTRLNSSHVKISYAVFCLKKKRHKK